jgi:hypothetical protein
MLLSFRHPIMSVDGYRPILPKSLASGYRPILPKEILDRSTAEPKVGEPNAMPIHPHLRGSVAPVQESVQLTPPDEFDFDLLTSTSDVGFTKAVGDHFDSAPLSDNQRHDATTTPLKDVPRPPRSSPRSIYWWERTVRRLKAQNETQAQVLQTRDAMLSQLNAEWIQLCEENRTLRTDIKIMRNARDLLLQEVSNTHLRSRWTAC